MITVCLVFSEDEQIVLRRVTLPRFDNFHARGGGHVQEDVESD